MLPVDQLWSDITCERNRIRLDGSDMTTPASMGQWLWHSWESGRF